MIKGCGAELWDNAAPLLFKAALAELRKRPGGSSGAIQIYTNSPRLPWELLAVPGDGGAREFLGVSYRVARWHITSQTQVLDRPAPQITLDGVFVVAPKYAGAADLPAQASELQAIARHSGDRFRAVDGSLAALRQLKGGGTGGTVSIVHFAGHGHAGSQGGEAAPQFAIRLADGMLPLLAWKGIAGAWGGAHPLVFFNACEVGRAEQSAGFVDGWGPAVLESGAGGYIGGLWPLGDRPAADAASQFYASAVGAGVPVAEAVRALRQTFYRTGDPTWMAYVFYGDAAMAVRPRDAESFGLSVVIGSIAVAGGLDPATVGRVIRRHLAQFRYCAEREAARTAIAGAATLQIVVAGDGTVAQAAVKTTTIAAAVPACWVERVRRIAFPPPDGGGMAMVTLPLAVK